MLPRPVPPWLALAACLTAAACGPSEPPRPPTARAGQGEAGRPPDAGGAAAPAAGEDPRASAFAFRTNPRVRHAIPLDRICRGIPHPEPRDLIPAIRRPVFVEASAADFLRDDDDVVGVVVGGEARAYATRILDRHEIVNDEAGGVPFAVTWCPLCDSALVFRRDLDHDPARSGETLRFGVSGWLYDNDLLFYDPETETFWQQITGRAVVGPLTGRVLDRLPADRMPWAAWRALHPATKALSWQTEHGRPRESYEALAYPEYRASPTPMFPVSASDPALPAKSVVWGVSPGGEHAAVPERALAGRTAPVEVVVGGARFRLAPGPTPGAWLGEAWSPGADGAPAGWRTGPWLRCFWFAWSAFHPETKVVE